jgi:uncharacterized repeat protein (TIGR01451 family)
VKSVLTKKGFLRLLGILTLTLAWPLAAAGQGLVATGSYTGDGNATKAISGLGFQPAVVLVKAETNESAYLKTAEMPDGLSVKPADNKGLETDRILTLDADGFTVGNKAEVNDTGIKYYWTALEADPVTVVTGNYTGDGSETRLISAAGLDMAAVLVFPRGNKESIFRHADMTGQESAQFNGSTLNDGITATGSDGFYVGSNDRVNQAGEDFYFLVIGAQSGAVVHGTYVGDETLDRAFTGLGFEPDFLMVGNSAGQPFVNRTADLTGNATLYFKNTALEADLITSLDADGFTIGDQDPVNKSGESYYWLGLVNPPEEADLQVQISADNQTLDEGDSVLLTVEVTNNGPYTTGGVEITSALATGLTLVNASPSQGSYDNGDGTWTVGDLNESQTETLLLTATVDGGTGGTILNQPASISAADLDDPASGNDSASVDLTIRSGTGADLGLALVADDASLDEGQAVTLTLTATNNGPEDLTNASVSVSLPAGFTFASCTPSSGSYDSGTHTWTLGAIATGNNAQLEIVGSPQAGTSGMNLDISATVDSSAPADPNNANDTATIQLAVNTVDMQVTVLTSATEAPEGATVTLTVVAANNGPGDASGLQVNCVLPAGLTFLSATPGAGSYDSGTGDWDLGSLSASSSALLALSVQIDGGTGGQTLSPSATVSQLDQSDPAAGNDSGSVGIVVTGAGEINLALTQNLDNASPAVGEVITYTITLENPAAIPATNVTVKAPLPAQTSFFNALANLGSYDQGTSDWTIASLPAGGSAVLYLQATVLASAVGTPVSAGVEIFSADQVDPDTDNNSSIAVFSVPVADLQLALAADNGAPASGETVTLTATVTNNGPNLATGIEVTQLSALRVDIRFGVGRPGLL